MPDETRHESADLEDFEVEDSTDTLSGPPGDDPLDRGVVPPERWSAGMRFGSTADEQSSGESLDQLLAEEEPDPSLDIGDDLDDDERRSECPLHGGERDDYLKAQPLAPAEGAASNGTLLEQKVL